MPGAMIRCVVLAGLGLLLIGCAPASPSHFRTNRLELARFEVAATHRRQIAELLEELFGTPDDPKSPDVAGLDQELLRSAAGSVRGDGQGRQTGLYRRYCAVCHGLTGRGYGPAAALLDPYPRDFTQGKFKFKSTRAACRPATDDLLRILERGIPGTSMPSYVALPDGQCRALVEYVQYLSIRGQFEYGLIDYCAEELDETDRLDADRKLLIDELLVPVAQAWREAPAERIAVPADPGSSPTAVAQGRELFYSKTANCYTCHDPNTPLVPQSDTFADEFDDWNKQVKRFLDSHRESDPNQLEVLAPRKIIPRYLKSGVFRGGSGRDDLYRRIDAGIDGTPMPAVGPLTPEAEGVLTSAQIWSLVDFVKQLPSEPDTDRGKPIETSVRQGDSQQPAAG
jgi:mono/diheme cytochrome c family protein